VDPNEDKDVIKREKTIHYTLEAIINNNPQLVNFEEAPPLAEDEDEEDPSSNYFCFSEIIKSPTSFEAHVKVLWHLVTSKKQVESLKFLDIFMAKIKSGIIKK
jgi:hypothetical protein